MVENKNLGRNVLITGGTRGIGQEAVRKFSALGDNVVSFYKSSSDKAELLSNETGAHFIKCDVSKYDEVKLATKEAMRIFDGKIDILICNAGISDFNLVTHIGAERWNEVINTNLNGMYYTISEVLPYMIDAKSGCIITISSMWGQVGASCEVAYSAAKAGVIGMTKALAKELGPSRIRVNSVAPGMIDTDMNSNVTKEVAAEIAEETPLERIGETSDVVDAMVFLSSDMASFITGQVIAVNGGLVI